MLRDHGYLVSCWTHERKHKEVKRFSNNMSNTHSKFDSNVLEAVIQAHLHALCESSSMPNMTTRLVSPKDAQPDVESFFQSVLETDGKVTVDREIYYKPLQKCSVHDVVVFQVEGASCVGQVWSHASVDGKCFTCIDRWASLGSNQFSGEEEHPMLAPSTSIQETCTFTKKGAIATLVPLSL